jgi:predicted MFS family arabinose efflux permease
MHSSSESVWANAPLRRLQIATAATSLGKWAFAVTLSVYAYRKGGAAAVGLVALIQAIPAACAAPFFGVAGDRYPRQRVLLVTNALRALLLAAVAVAVVHDTSIAVVFGLAALFSTTSTASQPARAALVPVLARTPREVSSATAVMGAIDTASFLAGAGVGGIVLAKTSVQFVVALCCLMYLAATVLLLEIGVDERPQRRDGERPLTELLAGFKTVLRDPQLRLATGTLATLSIVDGLTNVLVILTSIQLLDTGTAGIGYLNIAYGAGGLLGGTAAFALLGRSRLVIALALGCLSLGLPMILLGVRPDELLGLFAWAAGGFGFVIVKVSGLTLVQRLSGDRVLARVLAVVETTFVATIGLGAIIAPALVSIVGLRWALIVTGAILPLAAATWWPALRRLEIGAPVPPGEFQLLRHCPVFAPLPLATTEGLAQRLSHTEVAQGAEIITQGEPGDLFYLIAEGAVEVFQDGEFRRRQGPGESFGEIALLRSIPRTATVRATEPTRLLTLDRDIFLTSVTGHADSSAAAADVSERYLEPTAVG